MFKLMPEMTWLWPVSVKVPSEGGFIDQAFRARFRLAPDELRYAIGEARTDQELQQRTAALMSAALMEIYDVVDEHDAPVALNDVTRPALLANPLILRGLTNAYVQSLTGQPSAADAKN
jgi:hypothetical protein